MKTFTKMKSIALITACVSILAFTEVKAQDVIVLIDASEIQAKVTHVGAQEIIYTKWEAPNGPTYEVAKSDVFFIKYENGSKDVFNSKLLGANQEGNASTSSKGKYIHNILLNGYLEAGLPFTATAVGPALSGSIGARFYDYAFVGFNAGIEAIFTSYLQTGVSGCIISVPLMLDFRAFYPINDGLYTFIDLSAGLNNIFTSAYYHTMDYYGTIQTNNKRMSYDGLAYRMKIMFGVEYKRLEASFGYNCIPLGEGSAMHLGYFSLGLRLGRMR